MQINHLNRFALIHNPAFYRNTTRSRSTVLRCLSEVSTWNIAMPIGNIWTKGNHIFIPFCFHLGIMLKRMIHPHYFLSKINEMYSKVCVFNNWTRILQNSILFLVKKLAFSVVTWKINPFNLLCPYYRRHLSYSYEADFMQSLLSTGQKRLAFLFILTYRCIDDILSINNPEFDNYRGQMYPAELEINDASESTAPVSYLNLLLSIGRDGQLHTSIYDKQDDFNFYIKNFPFLSSNIPSLPAYGVFSQIIRYTRACSSYEGHATF